MHKKWIGGILTLAMLAAMGSCSGTESSSSESSVAETSTEETSVTETKLRLFRKL